MIFRKLVDYCDWLFPLGAEVVKVRVCVFNVDAHLREILCTASCVPIISQVVVVALGIELCRVESEGRLIGIVGT